MATVQKIFVLAMFLVISIEYGNCLKCFSCHSEPNGFCGSDFPKESHTIIPLENCATTAHFGPGHQATHCVKLMTDDKVSLTGTVIRACVPEDFCRSPPTPLKECLLCNTDACNSSLIVMPSLILSIVCLLVIKFHY